LAAASDVRQLGKAFGPLLHRYWQISRGMTLGVRALALDEEERVLLVQHSYLPGWYLPGGGVEPGETFEAAAARELAEEGGLTLLGRPALFGLYHNSRASSRDHVALYLVRRWAPVAPFRPGAEIVAARFFPCRDLPGDTTASTRRRVAEVIGGHPPALEW